MTAVEALHVVVPAHQEAELLGALLWSLRDAVAVAETVRRRVRFSVTVVLDACDDGTAAVASAFPEATLVSTSYHCVGAARHRGVERARRHGWSRPERTWIACTDADSRVPEDWLVTQLELAAHGADLVLGTVRPDAQGLHADTQRRWEMRHHLHDGHPYVHGANLGVRLAAYDEVGGFRPLRAGEDVDLARRIRETDRHVVRTAHPTVITSARLRGRVPDGFASYLTAL